ncbi:MAG: hypothetical protein O7G85_00115 [Planctomycetota bacterium]|nr:hypothetical protein [Planctomycetota bacterium]
MRIARRTASRRGNTMILVAAVLVLLIIIATAFVSRAQTGRQTSAAVNEAARRDDNDGFIVKAIAKQIAEHLFVREIIPGPAPRNDSNIARAGIDLGAVRFSFDLGAGDADTFPFNFAPYHVVPFTNWPDFGSPITIGFGVGDFPGGPGNPDYNPTGLDYLDAEGNPLGNPGFGDHRWLRDLEPLRFDADWSFATAPDYRRFDTFSHWRHLTNLSDAGNGWRICRDISDISDTDGDGNGGLMYELNIPVEQWLADPVPHQNDTGSGVLMSFFAPGNLFGNSDLFFREWRNWFSPGYFRAYGFGGVSTAVSLGPPSNFYKLSAYGPPSDEFIFGRERHMISRYLADADGDGYTDSFWHLVPNSPENGIRQIIAVSITDNSGRLNANVATQFRRDDFRIQAGADAGDPDGSFTNGNGVKVLGVSGAQLRERTIGATPADIALVGDFQLINNNWIDTYANVNNDFVGFLDSLHNWERAFPGLADVVGSDFSPYGRTAAEWDFFMWLDNGNSSNIRRPENFLGAIGIQDYDQDGNGDYDINPEFTSKLFRQSDRLRYWRHSGSRPFDPGLGLTPFTVDDELELRAYEGQNNPWLVSRFENALQSDVIRQQPAIGVSHQLLRANSARQETSEYLDQLGNRNHQDIGPNYTQGELLFEARRKLTLFNGSRNDGMPPWLWWEPRWDNTVNHPNINRFLNDLPIPNNGAGAINRFLLQSRLKLDLREIDPGGRNMFIENNPPAIDNQPFFNTGELYFDERLAPTLLLALTDGPIDYRRNINNDPIEQMSVKSYLGDFEYTRDTNIALPLPGISTDIDDDVNWIRKLAAGYAANIKAFRDFDSDSLLFDAERLPPLGDLPRDRLDNAFETELTKHRMLGMEKQPFLVEAIVAHIYKGKSPDFSHPGLTAMVLCDGDDILSDTIFIIQIANPYDTPIDLTDYHLKFFDQTNIRLFDSSSLLPELNRFLQPRDMRTFFLIEPDVTDDVLSGLNWKIAFGLDIAETNAVDIYANQNLLVSVDSSLGVQVNPAPLPLIDTLTERSFYDTAGGNEVRTIELIRVDSSLRDDSSAVVFNEVVVDRFDLPDSSVDLPGKNRLDETFDDLNNRRPNVDCADEPGPGIPWLNAESILSNTRVMYSLRVTRAWQLIDGASDLNELKSPRFVFHDSNVDFENDRIIITVIDIADPATWFATANLASNLFPRFSSRNKQYFGESSRLNFSMQMLQKDANFQQVGELLNVWLFGHEIRLAESNPSTLPDLPTYDILETTSVNDGGTTRTFSEFLAEENAEFNGYENGGNGHRVNRLRFSPITLNGRTISPVIGMLDPNDPNDPYQGNPYNDPRLVSPDITAGARVLDAFVCDSFGLWEDYDRDGAIDNVPALLPADERNFQESLAFGNAMGFEGKGTPGLININTATPEVMRALPHMDLMIHSDPSGVDVDLGQMPTVALPLAIVHYRERFSGLPKDITAGNAVETGYPGGADYLTRNLGSMLTIRGDRGIASIGELLLVEQPARDDTVMPPEAVSRPTEVPPDWVVKDAWRIDYAGENPFAVSFPSLPPTNGSAGAFLSSDVNGEVFDGFDGEISISGDGVAMDVEEKNLLFAGISNLISTRSDSFTIHLKIRSFKANPQTGIWDATDADQIVDERRYLIVVDRSNVNQPTDQPRILLMEKLPN